MTDLPEGWEWKTLGELTESTRPICYGVLKPGPFVPDGIPLLRIQDLRGNVVEESGLHYIGKELDREFARSRVVPGEVLLSIQGTIGRTAIVPERLNGANISRTLAVIHPDGRVLPAFLHHYLDHLGRSGAYEVGGSTRASLNISTIRQMSVPVPPLDKQERIVAAIEEHLSRVDAGAASLRSAHGRLERYLDATLAAAFDDGWPRTPLNELNAPGRPICYGILKPKTPDPGIVPYVEVRSIANGRIKVGELHRTTQALHDEFRRSELGSGDVVLAIRGSYDRAAVVPDELAGANVSRDVARIAPVANLRADFLAAFLVSPEARRYFRRHARGVAVQGVNIGDLRQLPTPAPSAQQQVEAMALVDAARHGAERIKAEIDVARRRADALRRSVLAAAFTGRLA